MDNRPDERIDPGRREARAVPGEPGHAGEREAMRERPAGEEQPRRSRPLTSLFKDLRDQTTTLIRQELALARAEMSEKAGIYGRNAGAIGAGAAILFAGVIVLLLAASAALYVGLVTWTGSHFLAGWLAPLIVGGLGALIGYAMMRKGIRTIRGHSPAPRQTVQTLQEDEQWLRNRTR
jgi:hypothetical protein